MKVLACVLLLSAAVAAPRAQTADERASARQVLTKRGDAVVTVLASIKSRMTMGGREMARPDESLQANATVLDATGLSVMSLTALEPARLMNGIYSQASTGGMGKLEMTTEPSNLRIRLADGTEVPAKIVLRDEDLDLVFLRPVDPPKTPLAFVDGPSGKVAALDMLILVQRLGETSSWKNAIALGYVQAVIDKPRTVYIFAASTVGGGSGLGSPAFDAAGNFLGVVVMRNTSASVALGSLSSFGGGDQMGILPIVLPADDIRDVAKQAK